MAVPEPQPLTVHSLWAMVTVGVCPVGVVKYPAVSNPKVPFAVLKNPAVTATSWSCCAVVEFADAVVEVKLTSVVELPPPPEPFEAAVTDPSAATVMFALV